MSLEHQEGTGFSLYERTIKIIQPCLGFLKNFSLGHPIHPLEPITPKYSEYLLLSNQKRLRIIHIKPNAGVNTIVYNSYKETKQRRSHSSLSEEYWFTRWSKPLKLQNCKCSFRRLRFSGLFQPDVPLARLSSFHISTSNIKNIEGYVESLIQDTLIEAFQEAFKTTPAKITDGSINLGFINSEEDINAVLLQQLFADETKICIHRSSIITKKPLVILLHGIGDSADIWWNVINTLVCKGYEIVAPDMLGHGYSSVPNNATHYKFHNILQYTLAVFDHYVGCDESKTCIIIAHSYGCSLATALCQHRSQQIIQLILISGGGPTPLAPPVTENEISSINCLHSLIKPLLFCGIQRTILYPLRGKHFEVCNPNNGVPDYILQYIANGQNWPEGDASFHRRILIPTLLVHGLKDNKVTLVQECEMERTIPRAFLELIPNAGHMCMLETPEHLSHMIICFIEWWSS